MHHFKFYKNLVAGFLVLIMLLLTGCSYKKKGISATQFVLDTVATITIYEGNQDVLDEAFLLCRKYENLFSTTVKNSDVHKLNMSDSKSVKVDVETAELILEGIKFSKQSKGKFDITIYPLSSLWNFTSGKKEIPNYDDIKTAAELVDYNNVKVNGNYVTLLGGSKIDLGGIAKGYIADKIAEFLRQKGVKNAIINLGGNVCLLGKNTDCNNFSVGIQTPFAETGETSAILLVSDKSVVTSGRYQRCFEKNGKTYHHILDPHTGMPAENDLDSVTIVSDSSVEADSLSTICMLLGSKESVDMIESIDAVEAVMILKTGQIIITSGLLMKNINSEYVIEYK